MRDRKACPDRSRGPVAFGQRQVDGRCGERLLRRDVMGAQGGKGGGHLITRERVGAAFGEERPAVLGIESLGSQPVQRDRANGKAGRQAIGRAGQARMGGKAHRSQRHWPGGVPGARQQQAGQQRQRRHVEDEIHRRMHEQAENRQYGEPARQCRAAPAPVVRRAHALPQPPGERERAHPGQDQDRQSEGSGFGQQLQVVVVRQIAVGTAVSECAVMQVVQLVTAQALARDGPFAPHGQGRAPHGEPILGRLIAGEIDHLAGDRCIRQVTHGAPGQSGQHEQDRGRRAPGHRSAAQADQQRGEHQQQYADRPARDRREQRPQHQREHGDQCHPGAPVARARQRQEDPGNGKVEQRAEGVEIQERPIAAPAEAQPFDHAPDGEQREQRAGRAL